MLVSGIDGEAYKGKLVMVKVNKINAYTLYGDYVGLA